MRPQVGSPPYGIFCDLPFLKPSDDDYMSVGLSVCPSAFLYVCHKKADFKNTELSVMNQSSPN